MKISDNTSTNTSKEEAEEQNDLVKTKCKE